MKTVNWKSSTLALLDNLKVKWLAMWQLDGTCRALLRYSNFSFLFSSKGTEHRRSCSTGCTTTLPVRHFSHYVFPSNWIIFSQQWIYGLSTFKHVFDTNDFLLFEESVLTIAIPRSVGCIMAEMITGRPLFPGADRNWQILVIIYVSNCQNLTFQTLISYWRSWSFVVLLMTSSWAELPVKKHATIFAHCLWCKRRTLRLNFAMQMTKLSACWRRCLS